MARSFKGTDRRAIKSARKAERKTRRTRQELSRAQGR